MSHRTTRRRFLRSALAANALAPAVLASSASRVAFGSANERLNLAFVGVGNKGWHNIQQLKSENVVALCDIDAKYLARAAEVYPKARQYRDYRKMLDAEQSQVDGVVVSTSDHSHAPATSAALDLGKHAYCEKPLAHTVREARVLAELARRNKLATQMGTQIHASDNYRRVVEIVQSGVLGPVKEVFTWCNKGWSNGRFQPWDKPVPPHVEWDLWLGPAPQRPYSPGIHPANWRRFWEYGSGTFGDMACHVVDLPFWALGLRHPTKVVCEGPEVHPDGTPEWVKATYEFPARGDRPAVTLHWSDGNAHFDCVSSLNDHAGRLLSKWGLGVLFVGERGMLAADYGRYQFLPQEKAADFQPPEKTIPDSPGHWNEWIQACKTGTPTLCNFDYSGALTESVLLGIVAYRSGQELNWDATNLVAHNCPAADEYLTKDHRKGFEVVGIG